MNGSNTWSAACACWQCQGKAHDDGTVHNGTIHWWRSPDPLTVEEPPAQALTRQTSRDLVIVCVAGMVLIAVLAWLAGRWS